VQRQSVEAERGVEEAVGGDIRREFRSWTSSQPPDPWREIL